ncbi:MAG: formate dehydrogenase accessory sulfurtransferase FdhD [Desulfitobacteriaceae bacterium]
MSKETITYTILKAQGSVVQSTEDIIVREIPLTIFYNKEEIVTILCSPSQIEELSIGFLLTEGFIRKQEDLFSLRYEPEKNLIWIEGQSRSVQKQLMSKRFLSACCGKSRSSFYFTNDASLVKPQTSSVKISLEEAYKYTEYLSTHLPLFQATGGVHSGGIAWRGNVLISSYDIGRHNVFDKLFGQAFRTGMDLTDHVIFFSGRLSSEILLKVAKMNIPIVIAKSAPTDLALNLANDLQITVVGFARLNRLNIYTHSKRIIIPDPTAVR